MNAGCSSPPCGSRPPGCCSGLSFGYRLSPAHRARGLATEAARAVIDDAFGRLALPELHAYAEPGNAPSHRVIARLGMTYLRDIRLHDHRWRLYRLRRPD